MSTSTVSPPVTSTPSKGTATALAVGSVFAVIGSIVFMTLNAGTPRESFSSPVSTVGGVAATAGAVALAVALARWRTTLPTWALTGASAALVIVAANAWFLSVGIRAFSDNTTNEEFERLTFESPWLLGMQAPVMVLGLVSYIALAVAGWRQRSVPRIASVLLVLAGLASVWPVYPPGLLLASIALFITSRSMART